MYWHDEAKMMGYDGLLNLSHSKDCRRLTHPTSKQLNSCRLG